MTNRVDEESESKVGHRCRNQCDNTENIQTDIRSNQDRRSNNKQQQYGGANIPVEEKIMVICEFGHKNQLSEFYVMRTDFKGVLRLYRQSTGVILETEGNIHQRYIGVLFHYKKSIKHTSDLSNHHVHSKFSLHLIRFFEKNH